MDNWLMNIVLIAIAIIFVIVGLTERKGENNARVLPPWVWLACLALWLINAGFNNIGQQLVIQTSVASRQARAMERVAELLNEQNATIPQLEALVGQLFPPSAASAASSPKK